MISSGVKIGWFVVGSYFVGDTSFHVLSFDVFPFLDGFSECIFELIFFAHSLFVFEVVDHVIDDVGWVFVDDFDHHSAEDGVDV